MKPPRSKKRQKPLPSPAQMLAAAKAAPAVFNISAYFPAVFLMRKKGYSWRPLATWIGELGVKISPVHLRRLFIQESKRLSSLNAEQLASQGCPADLIEELLRKDDPTERLTAIDAEDAEVAEARRKFLRENGLSEEDIGDADLTRPLTIGGKTL